jgi:hypothetical protein
VQTIEVRKIRDVSTPTRIVPQNVSIMHVRI